MAGRQLLSRGRPFLLISIFMCAIAVGPVWAEAPPAKVNPMIADLQKRVDALQARVDALQKDADTRQQLDKMANDLGEIKTKLEERPNAAPPEAWWALGIVGGLIVLAWWRISVVRELSRQRW